MTTRKVVVGAAAAVAVATALAAGAVWAQAHGPRGHAGHGPFGPFGMLATHHAIHELGLTEQQQTQIKAILKSHREELEGIMGRLRGVHESVRKIANEEPIDEAGIREGVREAVGPLGDLAVLHARVHREVGAVLTPEQRQKAEALHEKLPGHMEELRRHVHQLLEDPS